jgi:hypothetical protein
MGNLSGQNRTLISQGSERIRRKRRGEVPGVVARGRDVLPAERRDVVELCLLLIPEREKLCSPIRGAPRWARQRLVLMMTTTSTWRRRFVN